MTSGKSNRHKIREALQTAMNQCGGCQERLRVVGAYLQDGYPRRLKVLMQLHQLSEQVAEGIKTLRSTI